MVKLYIEPDSEDSIYITKEFWDLFEGKGKILMKKMILAQKPISMTFICLSNYGFSYFCKSMEKK